MGSPERFTFMFTPTSWALPLQLGWQPYYISSEKLLEIGIQIGPFGLSILFGKMEPTHDQ